MMNLISSAHALRSVTLAAHILALSMALGGCASVAPPSQLPQIQARHDLSLPAARELSSSGVTLRAWWETLQDPQLNQLLARAQARNPQVRAALATVQEARAMAGLASREGLPQGSLGLGGQVSRASQPEVDPYRLGYPRPPVQHLFQLTQALTWEIDLFGRVGTAQAVAERELDMSQADLHASQALLQAEVVARYIDLRAAQQSLRLLDEQVALSDGLRSQAAHRVSAGLMDVRELREAQADLARHQAERSVVQAQVKQSLAAIAVLCGHTPADFERQFPEVSAPKALPELPQQQVLQLPSEWLQRLPHVARADASLRASLGEVVLAQRAHWPRLSLGASLGLHESASRLGRASAVRYAAGPTLQWDWLDAGRLEAREAAAKAGSARAWAQFEQVVLQSLADGEGALSAWQAQYQGWQSGQEALQAASMAARYTRDRQQLGLEPALNAQRSEARELQAQQSALAHHARALQAYVRVQLALGAWQP